jgi:voltage-gated potassium channel
MPDRSPSPVADDLAGRGAVHSRSGTVKPVMIRRARDRAGVVRRRAGRRMVARALLTSAALVVLYYRLPLTGALDASAIAVLAVGLLVFAAVSAWQVRAILRSQYPALRAVEALAGAIPLFLVLFASAYLRIAAAQADAFSEPLSKTSALYFTITVFATVGFGDIAPRTEAARVATMVQMTADLVVVGLVVRVMLGAVRAGRQQRSNDSAVEEDATEQVPDDRAS